MTFSPQVQTERKPQSHCLRPFRRSGGNRLVQMFPPMRRAIRLAAGITPGDLADATTGFALRVTWRGWAYALDVAERVVGVGDDHETFFCNRDTSTAAGRSIDLSPSMSSRCRRISVGVIVRLCISRCCIVAFTPAWASSPCTSSCRAASLSNSRADPPPSPPLFKPDPDPEPFAGAVGDAWSGRLGRVGFVGGFGWLVGALLGACLLHDSSPDPFSLSHLALAAFRPRTL